MKLLLKCYSSDENWNGDCDWAYLDLTVELAQNLLQKISDFEVFRVLRQPRMEKMVLRNAGIQCFAPAKISTEVDAEDLDSALYRITYESAEIGGRCDDIVVLDDMYPDLIDRFRVEFTDTDYEKTVVEEDGIRFMCSPRSSSIDITTEKIPLDLLERALANDKIPLDAKVRE